MFIKLATKLTIYLIIIIAFIVLALSFYKGSRDMGWFIDKGSDFLGWFLFTVTFIYHSEDKFYWAVQKFKYFLVNPDTQWDLSVKYKINSFDLDLLSVLQKEISTIAILDTAETRRLSAQRIEIRADELIVEVYFDERRSAVEVFFGKIPVSFRGAQRTIEKRISPVLESIENKLLVSSKAYFLSVYFGDANPYFGLYMRRLRPQDVSEVNIKLKINDKDNMNVSKQKLTVTTSSLSDLGNSVRKYLTLSKLPA